MSKDYLVIGGGSMMSAQPPDDRVSYIVKRSILFLSVRLLHTFNNLATT